MATGIILLRNNGEGFRWNVSAHVGPGCPNMADDVQLVQFGFWCLGRATAVELSPAARTAYRNVVLGAGYSGASTDRLTIAIRTYQSDTKTVQDGRVSPIKHASGQYAEDAFWMIAVLGSNIRSRFPDEWPALHRVSFCPHALAAKSRDLFAR
jgi:hypothetical protein